MLPENVKKGAGGVIGTLAKVCSVPGKAVNGGANMAMDMAANLGGGAALPKPDLAATLNQFNLFSSHNADASLGQLPSPDAPDARGPDQRCR